MDYDNNSHILVNQKFNLFLETKITFENDQKTITDFTDTKIANDLENEQTDSVFITQYTVKYIFKNLKSKLSTDIDNILNIVLKKLPERLILNYLYSLQ